MLFNKLFLASKSKKAKSKGNIQSSKEFLSNMNDKLSKVPNENSKLIDPNNIKRNPLLNPMILSTILNRNNQLLQARNMQQNEAVRNLLMQNQLQANQQRLMQSILNNPQR